MKKKMKCCEIEYFSDFATKIKQLTELGKKNKCEKTMNHDKQLFVKLSQPKQM
jgi:hypothetical protein